MSVEEREWLDSLPFCARCQGSGYVPADDNCRCAPSVCACTWEQMCGSCHGSGRRMPW